MISETFFREYNYSKFLTGIKPNVNVSGKVHKGDIKWLNGWELIVNGFTILIWLCKVNLVKDQWK